jgi:hypothetical protein
MHFILPKPESFSEKLDEEFIQQLKNQLLEEKGYHPNASYIYEGTFVKLPPTIVKINSYGFRDDEFSIEKSNNTFRIIALGDSFTFGEGVNVSDSWPDQLEKKLNKLYKCINFDVLNFGVGGYTLEEKVKVFKKIGVLFNPDLVILQSRSGDELNSSKIKEIAIEILEEYIAGKLKISGDVKHVKQKIIELAFEKYTGKLNREEKRKNIEIPLKELIDIAKGKKINVIVVPFKPSDIETINVLQELSKKYDFYLLDLEKEIYSKYPKDIMQIHPLDNHPSKFAYDVISDYLLKRMVEIYKFKY